MIHVPPLLSYPAQLCRISSRPSRWHSWAAWRTSAHHGSLKETTSGVGLLRIAPAHGITVSARLKMVAPPMPASFIPSRSRVIPSALILCPIHIQSTYGRAESGGVGKRANALSSGEASGCALSRAGSGALHNCCVAPASKTQNVLLDTMAKAPSTHNLVTHQDQAECYSMPCDE